MNKKRNGKSNNAVIISNSAVEKRRWKTKMCSAKRRETRATENEAACTQNTKAASMLFHLVCIWCTIFFFILCVFCFRVYRCWSFIRRRKNASLYQFICSNTASPSKFETLTQIPYTPFVTIRWLARSFMSFESKTWTIKRKCRENCTRNGKQKQQQEHQHHQWKRNENYRERNARFSTLFPSKMNRKKDTHTYSSSHEK